MYYQLESSLIPIPQGALEHEGQHRAPSTLRGRVGILYFRMSQPLAVGEERPLLSATGSSLEEEKASTVGSHYSHHVKVEGSNLEKGILAEDQQYLL